LFLVFGFAVPNRRRVFLVVLSVVAGVIGAIASGVVLPGMANASTLSAVDAGNVFSCGITPAGGVQCWGASFNGALGNGQDDGTSFPTPVNVVGLSAGVSALASGNSYSCVIVNGGVKCWGSNNRGQLGDGTTTDRPFPVAVSGLSSGVTAIAVSDNYQTCAVVNGGAKCWGDNTAGQLGDGTLVDSRVPVDVVGLSSGVTAISAKGGTSCAIVTGGAMKCWGYNGVGQLGDGSNTSSKVPVNVTGLSSGVMKIAVGNQHTCAIVTGGAVKCWGINVNGEMGNGTFVGSNVPTQVNGFTSGATAIATGTAHTCAVVSGAAKCWGFNREGPLGNNTTDTSNVPVQVVSLSSGVTSISAGLSHSCAMVSGVATCWGQNYSGQLGDGKTGTFSPVPVNVVWPPDGSPIYAGVDLLSPTSVRIRWNDTSTDELGFLVYRSDGNTSTLVAGCPISTANLTQCVDTGLMPGTYYQYYVYAWNTHGATFAGTYMLTRTPDEPPAAPSMTFAYATGPNSVNVGWADNSSNETAFNVYQYVAGGYSLVGTTAPNVVSAAVSDPAIDTSVSEIFVVSAVNTFGETYSDSYIFSLGKTTPIGTLAPPSLGTLNVTSTSAKINWSDNANNESGYLVYRVVGSTATLVPGCSIFTPNLTTCTDSGLAPGQIYQYYVYPWNPTAIGYGGIGALVHTPNPLKAPTLTDAYGASSTSITVDWFDRAPDETGYTVYEYTGGTYIAVATTGPGVTTATMSGLSSGSTHVYIVAANRGADTSFGTYGLWATTL
jgi:trimeric autotransporter adhesin